MAEEDAPKKKRGRPPKAKEDPKVPCIWLIGTVGKPGTSKYIISSNMVRAQTHLNRPLTYLETERIVTKLIEKKILQDDKNDVPALLKKHLDFFRSEKILLKEAPTQGSIQEYQSPEDAPPDEEASE